MWTRALTASGLAVVIGLFSTATTTAAATTAAPTSASNCIRAGKDGSPQWTGEATPQASRAADALQAIVDRFPDEVAGVAHCSDFSGVNLYLKNRAGQAAKDAVAVQKSFPSIRIVIISVRNSLNDLRSLSESLVAGPATSGVVQGAGPDPLNDGVEVMTNVSSSQAERADNESKIRAAVPKSSGVRISERSSMQDASRQIDSPPYYMGGALALSASAAPNCSSGIPVVILSTHMLLTAGHCQGSVFYNGGKYVGSLYTTAWPGNADLYGDWELVWDPNYAGSKFGLHVFNGSVTSSSSLPITSGSYGGRPVGSGICTSGITTGQVCRYYVMTSYFIEKNASGQIINSNILRMYHDSAANGTHDSGGFRGGDSGGPCYFSDNNGGVSVVGIVKGGGTNGTPPTQFYDCTQLSGLRNWAPNAFVG